MMHPRKVLVLVVLALGVWGTSMFFSKQDLKFGQSSQLQFEQVIRDPFTDPPDEEDEEEAVVEEENQGNSSAGCGAASNSGKQGISVVAPSITVDSEGTVTDGGTEGLSEVAMESADDAFQISMPVGVEIALVNTEETFAEGILSAPSLVTTAATNPRGYVRLTEVYEVGGEASLIFTEPITLTFKLPGDKALLAPSIFYYDEGSAEWISIGGTLFFDSEDDLAITTEVNHLTKFTVFDKDLLSHPFVDIDSNWSRNYVADLWRKGIISGRDSTHFAPDAQITRAEFTKIMLLLLKYRIPEVSPEQAFHDVEPDEWYAPYLQIAKEEGIISGYEDGSFRPNAKISRAEALSVLFRAAKVDVPSVQELTLSKFPDVNKADWYADYVEFGVSNQVVDGYQNGNFGPQDNLTRAEAAKIASLGVARMMKLLGREGY